MSDIKKIIQKPQLEENLKDLNHYPENQKNQKIRHSLPPTESPSPVPLTGGSYRGTTLRYSALAISS